MESCCYIKWWLSFLVFLTVSAVLVSVVAADITLVKGNLKSVATALALSRATLRTIKQNLFWAFAYNVVLIPTAILSLHCSTSHPASSAIKLPISFLFSRRLIHVP